MPSLPPPDLQSATGRSLGLLGLLAAAVLLQPTACGGGSKGEQVSPATRQALRDAAELIREGNDAAAAASSGFGQRQDLASGFFEVMAAWQRVELMQVGPAGSSLGVVGGEDLRDAIYSWPTVNPCRVDQETLSRAWESPDYFDSALVNVIGMDAIEVLLFAADDASACPPEVGLDAEWTALGPDGIRALRDAHARVLAARVDEETHRLVAAWDGEDGFAEALANAGEPGSPYERASDGMDAIYEALFYLETETRERKLAQPLGLHDCGTADCLSGVETRLAGGSNEWIAANLEGFRALWAVAFDPVLREAGEDGLADQMLTRLDVADTAAAALTLPVDQAAATDPNPAIAVHDAIGEVTTLLEGDVATVLLLKVPSEAAGDND